MKNRLLIASAGAGKTTYIVKEALKCENTVLITTFTEENETEIRKKFIELNNGVIPSNVTIRTWFSFLIEHGAKPYQSSLYDEEITGLFLVNEKSGLKYKGAKYPVYYKEAEIKNHYFNKGNQIYSDKLSKFVCACDKLSKNSVMQRISKIFQTIFIDEVQDLAGYDLEVINLLFKSKSNIILAGDPRQVTYHTHFAEKHKQYSEGKIEDFIKEKLKKDCCEIDCITLKNSWRNNKIICDFANNIFPEYPQCESLQSKKTEHDGIFLVREKDVENYLEKYQPLQIRYSKIKKVNMKYEVKTYGGSKGITRERVIIYPTEKFKAYLFENKKLDTFDLRCKVYVAITRAKHSVAIVCENNIKTSIFPFYNENED